MTRFPSQARRLAIFSVAALTCVLSASTAEADHGVYNFGVKTPPPAGHRWADRSDYGYHRIPNYGRSTLRLDQNIELECAQLRVRAGRWIVRLCGTLRTGAQVELQDCGCGVYQLLSRAPYYRNCDTEAFEEDFAVCPMCGPDGCHYVSLQLCHLTHFVTCHGLSNCLPPTHCHGPPCHVPSVYTTPCWPQPACVVPCCPTPGCTGCPTCAPVGHHHLQPHQGPGTHLHYPPTQAAPPPPMQGPMEIPVPGTSLQMESPRGTGESPGVVAARQSDRAHSQGLLSEIQATLSANQRKLLDEQATQLNKFDRKLDSFDKRLSNVERNLSANVATGGG